VEDMLFQMYCALSGGHIELEIKYTGLITPSKTGQLDFSLNRFKGEMRENLGDFQKAGKI
jgi:hypothetical protein